MDRAEVEPVVRSFVRVKTEGFARAFYDRLLDADAPIRAAFGHTDFERQRELFLHGIYSLIDFARGGSTGRLGIRRLAKMHGPRRMDVNRRMYAVWTDCLLATLREHDPEWSRDLEAAWRRVVRIGVDAMLRHGGHDAAEGQPGSQG